MSTGTFRTLRELLEAGGVSKEDIDRAEADGTLGLLAVEAMVLADERPRYTQAEAEALTGLGEDSARFRRALGLTDPPPDAPVYSDLDIEMLRQVDQMLELGLVDKDVALQMARVIGSSISRIAFAFIDAIETQIDEPVLEDGTEPAVLRARLLLPSIPRILDYVWRRHIQVAARRRMVREAGSSGETRVTVGFADLVGFTALSQQVDEHELAAIVDRFESTAYEIVGSRGGRVVKMIGDEVMFAVDTSDIGVEISLSLAEAYHDDESLSDVRVGLAGGPVLEREADLYGPTVNLASRIVSIAYAGSVVVSDDIHDQLADRPDLRWKSLRTRYLKEIGRVRLWAVRRVGDEFEREGPFERARRRRSAIRDKLAEVIDARSGATEDSVPGGGNGGKSE